MSCRFGGLNKDLDLLLFDADGKSEPKIFRTQMVAKHGDESHGRINPYKITTKEKETKSF